MWVFCLKDLPLAAKLTLAVSATHIFCLQKWNFTLRQCRYKSTQKNTRSKILNYNNFISCTLFFRKAECDVTCYHTSHIHAYTRELIWKNFEVKNCLETPGIEPGTSHMRSERSTTELRPLRVLRCCCWARSEQDNDEADKTRECHYDILQTRYLKFFPCFKHLFSTVI